jgi:anti-sigma regulatory factor (Ser/Thr protein kinase)
MDSIMTQQNTAATSERIMGGPLAASYAREMLNSLLADSTAGDSLHDVLLLTTELVTNAVRHAHVDESGSVELTVAAGSDLVRVAVTDPGGTTMPHVQDLDPTMPGGMGLFLVDQIASRWGSERAPEGGTRVWFEVPR